MTPSFLILQRTFAAYEAQTISCFIAVIVYSRRTAGRAFQVVFLGSVSQGFEICKGHFEQRHTAHSSESQGNPEFIEVRAHLLFQSLSEIPLHLVLCFKYSSTVKLLARPGIDRHRRK
jgi:hypothetical protein